VDNYTGAGYLGKDIIGSVRGITNEYGIIEERYEYDVFGNPYRGDMNNGVRLGYTGKAYDVITGLYNYGYWDYTPETARFTTEDPIRDGANWFAYVNNDPVNWVDLWGLMPGDIFSSMDDVANDFGLTYNDDSINANREYGASIYRTDGGYTYTVPSQGRIDSVLMSVPLAEKPVAYLHTHGADIPNYDNYNFSSKGIINDVKTAEIMGIPFYLAAPNGALKVYDPETGSTRTVNNNMPRDPGNHTVPGTTDPFISDFKNIFVNSANFLITNIVQPIASLFSPENTNKGR
jgi:RHS repeat-associated protein